MPDKNHGIKPKAKSRKRYNRKLLTKHQGQRHYSLYPDATQGVARGPLVSSSGSIPVIERAVSLKSGAYSHHPPIPGRLAHCVSQNTASYCMIVTTSSKTPKYITLPTS